MIPSSHQLTLKLLQKCPSCQAALPASHIHILEETESKLSAHVSCSNCNVNYLTYIVNQPQGLVGNAIMTDLTFEEALRFFNDESLTSDAMLDLYSVVHSPGFIANLQISTKLNNGKDTNV